MTDLIMDEVADADLGDERLNDRLVRIVERLSQAPDQSIPKATRSRAEMEAAYRFFDNDKVVPDKILAPHARETLKRVAQHSVVLMVQDTTELDLTRPNELVEGAGPMDSESRRGGFLHPLMAFTPEGTPLGLVSHKIWTRESIRTEMSDEEKNQARKAKPIEEKESFRWLEGVRAARKAAAACPQTTCICVGDSESDIYEVLCEPRSEPAVTPGGIAAPAVHLLIRGCQSRDSDIGNVLDFVRKEPCLFTNTVHVSARKAKTAVTKGRREKDRDARTADVEVRAARVTLNPPNRLGRTVPSISINVVLVEETNPPEGVEPIQWVLLTTLPIDTPDEVKQIVKHYCVRWQIEVYFRTLKSGCHVEERQFEKYSRIENCVAVYAIIAWRVMYLCCLGRECPDMSCEVVFTPGEWKSVYKVKHRNQKLPSTPPSLNTMIRMIATLGGYVDRPTTEPGTKTLWIGLRDMYVLALAWDTFGPESGKES